MTLPTQGVGSYRKSGGDGRHAPGRRPHDERARARRRGRRSPAPPAWPPPRLSPAAIPPAFAGPSGVRPQVSASYWTGTPCAAPETRTDETRSAAVAAAACFENVGFAGGRGEIRTVAPVDGVDRVVDGALDHGGAEDRGVRRRRTVAKIAVFASGSSPSPRRHVRRRESPPQATTAAATIKPVGWCETHGLHSSLDDRSVQPSRKSYSGQAGERWPRRAHNVCLPVAQARCH